MEIINRFLSEALEISNPFFKQFKFKKERDGKDVMYSGYDPKLKVYVYIYTDISDDQNQIEKEYRIIHRDFPRVFKKELERWVIPDIKKMGYKAKVTDFKLRSIQRLEDKELDGEEMHMKWYVGADSDSGEEYPEYVEFMMGVSKGKLTIDTTMIH